MKNRILIEYSLVSFLFTLIIAVFLSTLFITRFSDFALDQHVSFLLEYFDSIPGYYPELAEPLESDDSHLDDHSVDHFSRDLFLFPSVTRIKIIDLSGAPLWEMNREIISKGMTNPDNLEIASNGEVVLHIQKGQGGENPILHL